uniref:F-box domain-containing protein n=1 Tax=Glossina austeni TaxID=7395 RepID=A0A1A9V9E9_GLOAU
MLQQSLQSKNKQRFATKPLFIWYMRTLVLVFASGPTCVCVEVKFENPPKEFILYYRCRVNRQHVITLKTLSRLMAESVIDDNASKVTIFDLNFDCLSKIFNSLELDNLLDLRKVCDFFDDVVVKYFRRSKIIKIDDKFIVKYSKYMREYLCIISESVEDLVFKIECEYEPDKITSLIENLVFDQVHTLEVDDPFTEQLMPITNFPNVVTLRRQTTAYWPAGTAGI